MPFPLQTFEKLGFLERKISWVKGHSHKTSDELDIDYLAAGRKDYWINSTPNILFNTKKIIITDWNLDNFSLERIYKLFFTVESPFEIYLWQDESIQRVYTSTDFMSSLSLAVAMREPIDLEKIELAALEKGWAADQIINLDFIKKSEIIAALDNQQCVSISLNLIAEKIKDCPNFFDKFIYSLQPHQKVKLHYRKQSRGLLDPTLTIIASDQLNKIMSSCKVTQLICDESLLLLNDIQFVDLKTLYLDPQPTCEQLIAIRIKYPEVNKILAQDSLNTKIYFGPDETGNLMLGVSLEDPIDLGSILQTLNSVKPSTLVLINVNTENLTLLLSSKNIFQFEKIIINARVSHGALELILKKCPHLKRLQIAQTYSSQEDTPNAIKHGLTQLIIEGCDSNNITQYLSGLSELNHLSLKGILRNYPVSWDFDNLHFPKLNIFKLRYICVQEKNLFNFLNMNRNIQTLSVNSTRIESNNRYSEADYASFDMPELELLKIRHTGSVRLLELIIPKAKKLKAISAKNFERFEVPLNFDNTSLSELKRLTLVNGDISAENLNLILTKAEFLERLEINLYSLNREPNIIRNAFLKSASINVNNAEQPKKQVFCHKLIFNLEYVESVEVTSLPLFDSETKKFFKNLNINTLDLMAFNHLINIEKVVANIVQNKYNRLELPTLGSLTSLHVMEISGKDLALVLMHAPHLSHLHLGTMQTTLDVSSLPNIALTHLNLKSEEKYLKILTRTPKLISLGLNDFLSISIQSLINYLTYCPTLKYLKFNVSNIYKDDHLENTFKNLFPQLESVIIHYFKSPSNCNHLSRPSSGLRIENVNDLYTNKSFEVGELKADSHTNLSGVLLIAHEIFSSTLSTKFNCRDYRLDVKSEKIKNIKNGVITYAPSLWQSDNNVINIDIARASLEDNILLMSKKIPTFKDSVFASTHVLVNDGWAIIPSSGINDFIRLLQCAYECESFYDNNIGLYKLKFHDEKLNSKYIQINWLLSFNPVGSIPQIFFKIAAQNFKRFFIKTYYAKPIDKSFIKSLVFLENEDSLKLKFESCLLSFDNNNEAMPAEDLLIQFINLLTAFCLTEFRAGDISKSNAIGADYLNCLLQETKGACRHKGILFKAIMDQFQVPCRIVRNKVHLYVEVAIYSQWERFDLGGLPSEIKIIPLATNIIECKKTKDIIVQTPVTSELILEVESPTNKYLTWDVTSNKSPRHFVEYWLSLEKKLSQFSPDKRNLLVTINNESDLVNLHHSLLIFKNKLKHKVFILHTLSEISATGIKIVNDNHPIKSTSELVEFIKHAKSDDVLIVNWSNHDPEHIGYNSMVNTQKRLLCNIEIPHGVIVVGIITQDKRNVLREDFFSRYRVQTTLPQNIQFETRKKLNDKSENPPIKLYGNDNWQPLILGNLVPSGGSLTFAPGPLINAIKKEKGINLVNPLNSAEFQYFTSKLLTSGFEYYGNTYCLPENFSISIDDSPLVFNGNYSIEALNNVNKHEWDYAVNIFNFENLFRTYIYLPSLNLKQGWLNNANNQLTILVTKNLPDSCWARLVDYAQRIHLKIIIVDVELPQAMLKHQKSNLSERFHFESGLTDFILTNDINFTVEKIIETEPNAQVFTIDHSMKKEVIENIESHTTDNISQLKLNHYEGFLTKALCSNKPSPHVILKMYNGSLSPQLEENLKSLFCKIPYLFVNGEKKKITCRVTLITNNANYFSFLNIPKKNFTSEDILQFLSSAYDTDIVNKVFALAKEKRKPFLYANYKSILEKIKNSVFSLETIFDAVLPEPNNTISSTDRIKNIAHRLAHDPTLFLMGGTGVGKSTMVLKELSAYLQQNSNKTIQLFVGMDKLKQWAMASSDIFPILFVDEANLLPNGTLEIFEGLYQIPAHIIIDGEIYYLKNHKVIFAGNMQYYANRVDHYFNIRHANYLMINGFSDNELKEKMIYPFIPYESRDFVTEILISTFHFVNQNNTGSTLSPRNLMNICFRLNNFLQSYPEILNKSFLENLKTATLLSTYDEIRYLVQPECKRLIKEKLLETLPNYKELKNSLAKLAFQKSFLKDFLVTKTHKNIFRIVQDKINLRKKLLEQFTKISSQIRLSKNDEILNQSLADTMFILTNISSLLLEGLPCTGKSAIIEAALQAAGLQLNFDFYIISPCIETSKTQLLDAFHKGLPVIIDELNTLPFLENILNALISGVDLNGDKAKLPGFIVFATQNPISFAHRKPLPEALRNRFLSLNLKQYDSDDLLQIALYRGIEFSSAKADLTLFSHTQIVAKHLKKSPPGHRDFISGFNLK